MFLMRLSLSILGIVGFTLLSLPQVTLTQVVPDRTFNSKATPSFDNSQVLITGGSAANKNLFHSFNRFSLSTGQTAIFAPDPAIVNVITRITGNTISNIDGTIAVQGDANLFLINPNGIAFGRNAALAINGSFFATTAPGLKFADGSTLSTNITEPPLLIISAPIEAARTVLQAAPITNLANLTVGKDLSIVAGQVSSSGQFNAGDRISINANHLTIEQGKITANRGINLDVQDAIVLKSSQIDSTVTGTQTKSGDINAQARSLTLLDGATINSSIQPNAQGTAGNINLKVQENIEIGGMSSNGIPSGLNSIIQLGGQGIGGKIAIDSDSFSLFDGGTIQSILGGSGSSGSIEINVRDSLKLIGGNSAQTKIMSFVPIGGFGTNGSITLSAGTVLLTNGAKIHVPAYGQATGGDITIRARDSINIEGTGQVDSIWLQLVASLFLEQNLRVENNALGDRGRVLFSLDALFETVDRQTGIYVASTTVAKSGNVTLSAPSIALSKQALISANNWAFGDTGSLQLIATKRTTLDNSFLFAATILGKGANIEIDTPSLKLSQSRIVSATTNGAGGNITLNVPKVLLLRHGSQIASRAFNDVNSGNIRINSNLIVANPIENSKITANAFGGKGGNIAINARSLLGIKHNPIPTSESEINASSNFGISGEVKLTVFRTDPSSELAKLPIEVTDLLNQIAQACSEQSRANHFIVTGRGGIAPNLAELNRSPSVWTDTRSPESAEVSMKNDRTIEATGWIKNSDEQVVLVAEVPSSFTLQTIPCSLN